MQIKSHANAAVIDTVTLLYMNRDRSAAKHLGRELAKSYGRIFKGLEQPEK